MGVHPHYNQRISSISSMQTWQTLAEHIFCISSAALSVCNTKGTPHPVYLGLVHGLVIQPISNLNTNSPRVSKTFMIHPLQSLTEDLFCISSAVLRICNTKGTLHPVFLGLVHWLVFQPISMLTTNNPRVSWTSNASERNIYRIIFCISKSDHRLC
jgi:hypothetical protein